MVFKTRLQVLGLFLLVLVQTTLAAQSGGFKFFKNYGFDNDDLQPQNWAILQDHRGIVYAANQGGVAEYDGVSWRNIKIPNYRARSLAIDDNGTIYVGGKNEIGFLQPDSKGQLHYVSLVSHIDEDKREFGNVWKSHWAGGTVYYRTSKFLFGWRPGTKKMAIWEPVEQFNGSFAVNDSFYITQKGVGLMQVEGDALKLAPGGEFFAEKRVYLPARYDREHILIGTGANGFYLYDGSNVVPFPTEVDQYVKENRFYHGIALSRSPGDFALATLRGGVAVIDAKGRLKHLFNRAWGLQAENVKFLFEDPAGNLWLALNNGISMIEYSSPITQYDGRNHLSDLVLAVVKHDSPGQLYAGTTSGLFLLRDNRHFVPVPGITDNCWSLLDVGDSILAATSGGVFQVTGQSPEPSRIIDNPAYVLHPSRVDPNRVWVGTRQGLVSIYSTPRGRGLRGQWHLEKKLPGIDLETRTIVEDPTGDLWLGTLAQGVIEVDFQDRRSDHTIVKRYDTNHGLPRGEANVFWAADHLVVATVKGIYRFDKKNRRFIPDPFLGEAFCDGSRDVFRMVQDRRKNLWLTSGERVLRAVPGSHGEFTVEDEPFLRLPKTQVNDIYPDPGGGAVWFAGQKGLFRYDIYRKKDYRTPFQVVLRKVVVKERPVFEGHKGSSGSPDGHAAPRPPVFDYKERNMRFQFAAPFFEDSGRTRYRCRLEGYDKDWSGWTHEPQKDYTNLDYGTYTFRVQARNLYGRVSREDTFLFKILPPWYLTWWAYLFYGLVFFMAMNLVVRWRSRSLQKEKTLLEQIVNQRTEEVRGKNRQLQEQSEKLEEMDRIKSRFFTNISHEFRTPLTLIMGPLEQLLSRYRDKETVDTVNLALYNSRRLLTLINQLLDLAKFDAGKMRLRAAPQNVTPFLKTLVGSFDSLAQQKDLDLSLNCEDGETTLYFDTEKLEKILVNLVANAVKFTPAGGKITVTAAKKSTGGKNGPANRVEISVHDTGPGIPAGQLPYIFDRFYRDDGPTGYDDNPRQKGTGIGLALVKELVTLHHGDIEVQSTPGEGSVFTVRLPLGAGHLSPGEIVARPHNTTLRSHDFIEAEPVDDETGGDLAGSRDGDGEDVEKDVVLVVEDNPNLRRYIRRCLQSHYTVAEAADGKQGLDKAKALVPDLVVSDIMMPEMDGFQLCGALKKDVKTSHIPVILLTAKASQDSVVQGLETGADDYVTKPFNTKILLTRIKNLIDLRRGLQEKIQRDMLLQPDEIAVSSIDREFMNDLKTALEKHMSDPGLSVDKLAKIMLMGQATLNRKIRALTGESTNRFIQSYRLKRAALLLKAGFGNVTEVAFEVGFSSSSYFARRFKETFHRLPHAYQAAEAGQGPQDESTDTGQGENIKRR